MGAAFHQAGEIWKLSGLEHGFEDLPIGPVPPDDQYSLRHKGEGSTRCRRRLG